VTEGQNSKQKQKQKQNKTRAARRVGVKSTCIVERTPFLSTCRCLQDGWMYGWKDGISFCFPSVYLSLQFFFQYISHNSSSMMHAGLSLSLSFSHILYRRYNPSHSITSMFKTKQKTKKTITYINDKTKNVLT
jgi:hypothetical protein